MATTEHRQNEPQSDKRRDYFAAGTLCVRNVDLLGPDVIKAYFAADPDKTIVFPRGDVADAGDAIPGWSMQANELFWEDER